MSDSLLRVLLVEDDEDDYLLTRDLLAEVAGQRYILDWVTRYEAALDVLAEERHDVYLLDYHLGARTGLELLREAVARGCRGPLILLTGQGDREVDVEAMRAGACDFLSKGRMDAAQLERAIRYAVERKRSEDELRRMRDELEVRVRDRTAELARTNEELTRAKEAAEAASRSKDQFLAVLSHELRNPLNPVLVGISAMLEAAEMPATFRPVLEIARRNVELEARLIDDLLDVTRIAQGKLSISREVVDLHALVELAAEGFRDAIAGAGLTLELDLAAPRHHVDGDPARLQQIASNLIRNAIKFTPAGGKVTVRSVGACLEGRASLRLEVHDTGIGIAPKALSKIFNAFEQGGESVTRRFGGLGLGLAISRSLALAHDGRLIASSEGPDRGACFSLELPVVGAPRPKANGRRPALPAESASRPLAILFVEDNADTLQITSRLLRSRGHRVVSATSIAAASEVAETDGPFDLLISDIGLPDGSGLDLMRHLLGRGPIRGIALSGYGMDGDRRRSEEAGFSAHLTKPIDFARLEEAILDASSLIESG